MGNISIKIFIENSFKAIDQVFQMELGVNLETKQEKFYQKQTTGILRWFLRILSYAGDTGVEEKVQ